MPRIITTKGTISYKTHPLYLGVKRIDKKIATENLLLLKQFLDEHAISFGLIAGTLLGAVREKDFIAHDEDIDLFVLAEHKDKFLASLFDINRIGFEIARYDRRGLLSIIRRGEYIDIYFFEELGDGIRNCCGWCVPETFLTDTVNMNFKDAFFVVPKDYIGFLEYEYGENWRTPVKWADFELPEWRRKLYEYKENLKEILPDFIFYPIAKRIELKVMMKYERKMEKYNKIHETSLSILKSAKRSLMK